MVYQFNNVAHVTIAALLLALSFYASKRLVLHRRRQAFKRLHGAHDAPWLPTQNLVQRWIGLDLLWSNVRAFRNHNFLETSKQRIKETGLQTYQQTLAGSHTLLTIELDNLKAIQATNFKSFGLSEQRTNAHTLLGYSIFTTNGAAWAHSRELLRPQFVRAQVFNLARTFKPHVDELITALPRDRRSFNLEPFFFRLTMDTATEFLFGESTNSVATGTDGGFGEALTMAVDHTIRVARYGLLGKYLLPSRGSSAARDHVHRFVDNIVDRGLAKRAKERSDNPNVERRYCFLDALASETDDRLRIRSELLSVLMAGRSTTANLLTNVWFILSTRPDIWTKVQEEVATLGGTEPTIEQLKELKYVGAVVNESLRMHPVVAINTRLAFDDTILPVGGGGDGRSPLFVAKGTTVIWSVYALHRRKDIFGDDADEFKPERWFDDAATGRKGLRGGWAYLPFNGGARVCLGQQFALTETAYTTIRLCQAFDRIEPRGPQREWRENIAKGTCLNLDGAQVSLHPRAV